MITDQSERKTQIVDCEKKLLKAFEKKDLTVIDEMLHDDALFVYPNGQKVTKAMVMENYKTGNSEMTSITSSDQIISLIEDTAVVSINLALEGKYFDQTIKSEFRYIRVWKLVDEAWKVIAVSGVPMVNK